MTFEISPGAIERASLWRRCVMSARSQEPVRNSLASFILMRTVLSFVLGQRDDWHLRAPWMRGPRIGLHWVGPLVMFLSVAVGWFAFSGTAGLNQNSTFSMWIGSTSIILMAWSFILALRISMFERFWGGLDSMYRAHRWAGALAVVSMFLHTRIEPETKGADVVAGASKSVADSAQDLAETAELLLYGLIGLSLVRLIPYRWWRWTHKLFVIPFGFASWHFFTARKPYENSSLWGWWFGGFMIFGAAAYFARVFVRDTVASGRSYTVVSADHSPSLTRLELEPQKGRLDFEPGQFAFVRLDIAGMREPHPFSIASAPNSQRLTFYVRELGDWSDRLRTCELLGSSARIEGPYGSFQPISRSHPETIWIAGGVGITPFLASLDQQHPKDHSPPTLLYACRNVAGDPLVDLLERADAAGRIRLRLFHSGNRITAATLDEEFPDGLLAHHVALCGPGGLVRDMAEAASSRGATSIETEDFDLRQGFGPERSREIETVRMGLLRR